MIEIVKGDIRFFAKHVEAVVNPVNCEGISDSGLSLDFKIEYPDLNIIYVSACRDRRIRIGKVLSVPRLEWVPAGRKIPNPGFIIYFPVKDHWRDSSLATDIELGLYDLAAEVERLDIRSIAIPAMGCSLESKKWPNIMDLMRILFNQGPMRDVRVCLFGPVISSPRRSER